MFKIWCLDIHYDDVIMTTVASQITSLTVVYSTVCSDADQRKHQSYASLAFVWEITETGEFPAQTASYAENVSIWWRHHVFEKKMSPFKHSKMDALMGWFHTSSVYVGNVVYTWFQPSSFLTHWLRHKIDIISQTTFSNAFSWMAMYEFRLRFYWSFCLSFKLAMFQH